MVSYLKRIVVLLKKQINYFDLSNIKLSKEQKELETLIKEIKTLQDNNERIFNYIVKPNNIDNIQDEHINILKLNMKF